MLINTLADEPGEDAYYEGEFLNMVESHFTYLRSLNKDNMITVVEGVAYKYEGDFYGLLRSLNIEKQYHTTIMTYNGLRSPLDYDKGMLNILVPPLDEIELLKAVYETRITIN